MTWTQEQSINFECAREVINDLMAICSNEIYVEEHKVEPNNDKIDRLEAELIRLKREKSALSVNDDAAVAEVRSKYSPLVRAWRDEHNKTQAA